MARPMTRIFRQCSLRVILALGFMYFLVMYAFHISLQNSGEGEGGRRTGSGIWDRMEVGADAVVDPTPRRHVAAREDHLQKAFDRIQQDAKKLEPEKRPTPEQNLRFLQPEPDLDRDMNVKRMTSDDALDDVNIPPNCRHVYTESEFRFQRIGSGAQLYSAYWDSRPNDFDNRHNGSFIRIMAILPSGARPTLGCLFDQTDTPDARTALESRITYYEMCENHGRPWGGYILSCPVPPTVTIPTCSVAVALVTDNRIEQVVRIRIRTLEPVPEKRMNFGVCVPPLFGSVSLSRLIEFLEMSRLLGVEHVTLYDFDMTSEVRSVLDHYVTRTRFASVIPWRLDRSIDQGIWYHGQLIAIQDCLYRSMATVQFASFNDIDEFVVPQNFEHWKGLMGVLDQPNRCAFQFKSAFFKPDPDTNGKDDTGLDLQTLVHLQRTSSFDRIRTKCMVKTFSIFEKGIHHVSKPIWANLEVHRVEPEVAFLHHYRVCLHGMGMNCGAYEVDSSMLRFKDRLINAVNGTKIQLENVIL